MVTPARSASDGSRRAARATALTIVAACFVATVAAAVPAVPLSPPAASARPLPALERHAEAMRAGFAALERGEARDAQALLASFSYGARPVEQARLWWLALAQEANQEATAARRTLAKLRARGAAIAERDEALAKLASLYRDGAAWSEAASVLEELRATARAPAAAQRAARDEIGVRLALGDPGAMLARARELAARASPGEADAEAIAMALTGAASPLDALAPAGRIERAWNLAAAGDAVRANEELGLLALSPLSPTEAAQSALTRALVAHKSGKHSDAIRIARPLASNGELALRAVRLEAEASVALLAAAEASSYRIWTVKEKAGTRRVRVKGRWTTRTIWRSVQKKARKSDARTRRQLAAARAEATVALERLLELQDDPVQRQATLRRLATIARDAEDRDALEARIAALVAIDPREDHLLQEEWNDAWGAWRAKKAALARERFGFIQRTWAVPAAARQARYWYARALEKGGEPREAKRIYDELASVARDDVYATFARSRGGSPVAAVPPPPVEPAVGDAPPAELALARELVALGIAGEARAEARAAQSDANRRWFYTILAESHAIEGAQLLTANALRRAFPEIGTVAEDRVPERYRAMYYGNPHRELLASAAAEQGIEAALVLGLVMQESSGDAGAGSRAGAVGLMQLMPATAAEVARKAGMSYHQSRLTEPELNVALGTRYLRELLGMMNGDEILALASYNAGFGNVQRWLRASRGAGDDEFLESIPYQETRGYVKRVLYYRSVYRAEAAEREARRQAPRREAG